MIFKKIRKLQLGGAMGQSTAMGLVAPEFQVMDTTPKSHAPRRGSAGRRGATGTSAQDFKKGLQSDRMALASKIAEQQKIMAEAKASGGDGYRSNPAFKAAAAETQRLTTTAYGLTIAREKRYGAVDTKSKKISTELAMNENYAFVTDSEGTPTIVPTREAMTAKVKDDEGNMSLKYTVGTVASALAARSNREEFSFLNGNKADTIEDIITNTPDTATLEKNLINKLKSSGFSSEQDETVSINGRVIDIGNISRELDNLAGKSTKFSQSNEENLKSILGLVDLGPILDNKIAYKVAQNHAHEDIPQEQFNQEVQDEISAQKARYVKGFLDEKYKKKLGVIKGKGKADAGAGAGSDAMIELNSFTASNIDRNSSLSIELDNDDKDDPLNVILSKVPAGNFNAGANYFRKEIQGHKFSYGPTTDEGLKERELSITNSGLFSNISPDIESSISVGTSGKTIKSITTSYNALEATTIIGNSMQTTTLPRREGSNVPDWEAVKKLDAISLKMDKVKRAAAISVSKTKDVDMKTFDPEDLSEERKKIFYDRVNAKFNEFFVAAGLDNPRVVDGDFLVSKAAIPLEDIEDKSILEHVRKATPAEYKTYLTKVGHSADDFDIDQDEVGIASVFTYLVGDMAMATSDLGLKSVKKKGFEWNNLLKAGKDKRYDFTSMIHGVGEGRKRAEALLKKYTTNGTDTK